MKKYIYLTIIANLFFINGIFAANEENLAHKLAGKILLQVEQNGEAWYVDPKSKEKYYLDKPAKAFEIMEKFGIGISNDDLDKIPIAILQSGQKDSDHDGLPDNLENTIGTNLNLADSDNDGYSDGEEIINNYNPLTREEAPIDINFTKKQSGKILLQVEKNGEAWYVNPDNHKRYFLGRPIDAFELMKNLGLGISDINLSKIPDGYVYKAPPETPSIPKQTKFTDTNQLITTTAKNIRQNNLEDTLLAFSDDMQQSIEYTMNFLNSEQRLTLANILSDTSLSASSDSKKTYSTEIFFNGEKHKIDFHTEKQTDGNWLLTNL